jgi:hypothetical protein
MKIAIYHQVSGVENVATKLNECKGEQVHSTLDLLSTPLADEQEGRE